MKIPSSLDNIHIPTLDESIHELLNSISKEEAAISVLITSEAKKITAFVGKEHNFPTCKSSRDIVDFSHTVNHLLEAVLMKEWLLLKKLETVLSIKNRLDKTTTAMYDDVFGEDDDRD